jgi:hypothetical protein
LGEIRLTAVLVSQLCHVPSGCLGLLFGHSASNLPTPIRNGLLALRWGDTADDDEFMAKSMFYTIPIDDEYYA